MPFAPFNMFTSVILALGSHFFNKILLGFAVPLAMSSQRSSRYSSRQIPRSQISAATSFPT